MAEKAERPTQMLYSVRDAARELGGISVWTLRKHISQGTVRPTRLGRRVFLSAEELTRIQREGLPFLKASAAIQATE